MTTTRTASHPCPVCGGNTRYTYWRKLDTYKCCVCGYQEQPNASAASHTAAPQLTPAEIDQVHNGYTVAAAYCASLLWGPEGAEALAYLRQRGFTDATIRAAQLGYHPTTQGSAGLASALKSNEYDGCRMGGLLARQGRALALLQDAITIPYVDAQGVVRFLRTRKLHPKPGDPKYLSPIGPMFAGGAPIFYGQALLAETTQSGDPRVKSLVLTEGEFKALALTQAWRENTAPMPAIATPGGSYLPDELCAHLVDRQITLVYDMERQEEFLPTAGANFTTRAIERLTGAGLDRRIAGLAKQASAALKAKDATTATKLQADIDQLETERDAKQQRHITARVVRLPLPAGVNKVDLDSFLLEHGADALKLLLSRAQDAGAWYELHANIPYRYDIKHGVMQNGSRRMANYLARIVEDVTVVDGLTATAACRLLVQVPGGAKRNLLIPSEVWADPRKAIPALRAGLLENGWDDEGQDTLRAIRLLSRLGDDPPKATRYTATGWQQIGDHWHYLTSDGAIGATGSTQAAKAEIDPAAQGNHYALCGPGDAQTGGAAWLRFLRGDACPQPLALLLAAQAALALVHRFTGDASRPLAWLYSESGAMKTALLRAGVMALWGPRFTAERADGAPVPKWDATSNGIAAAMFYYRDSALLVDDYKQATIDPKQAARILHNYSEGASRTRMTQDLKLRTEMPARCVLFATGEDLPQGDTGQMGRILGLELRRGAVREDALTELQRAGSAGHLAAFWRGFVQALAVTLDQRGPAGLQAIVQTLMQQDDQALPGHRRTAGALRQNRGAWLLIARYLVEAGYLTAAEADQLSAAHLEARDLLAKTQQQRQETQRPANIFLDILRERLATGELVIEQKQMPCPVCSGQLTRGADGWHCQNTRDLLDVGFTRYVACTYRLDAARIIGFAHALGVGLYAEKAYQYVASARASQRQALNYSATAVWQQIDADGLIVRKQPGRFTHKVRNPATGISEWVLLVCSSALAVDDVGDDVPMPPADVPASSHAWEQPPTAAASHPNGSVPNVPIDQEETIRKDDTPLPDANHLPSVSPTAGSSGTLGTSHQDALNGSIDVGTDGNSSGNMGTAPKGSPAAPQLDWAYVRICIARGDDKALRRHCTLYRQDLDQVTAEAHQRWPDLALAAAV